LRVTAVAAVDHVPPRGRRTAHQAEVLHIYYTYITYITHILHIYYTHYTYITRICVQAVAALAAVDRVPPRGRRPAHQAEVLHIYETRILHISHIHDTYITHILQNTVDRTGAGQELFASGTGYSGLGFRDSGLGKSAARRDKSREWDVSKQKWNLC